MAGGDSGVELFNQRAGCLDAIERSAIAGQRPGGVGVAAPVDHAHQAFLETASVEKAVENRLKRVNDVALVLPARV